MTVVLGWLYCHFFLPHCFLPFALLFFSKYIKAYTSVLFIEYLFFIGWHVWGKLVKMWLLSENKKDKPVGDNKDKKIVGENSTSESKKEN